MGLRTAVVMDQKTLYLSESDVEENTPCKVGPPGAERGTWHCCWSILASNPVTDLKNECGGYRVIFSLVVSECH
jgi:hypothetical protein